MTDKTFFHCCNCEMGFRSRRLLEKHTEKFCIGREMAMNIKYRHRQAQHKGKEPKKTEMADSMLHVSKLERDNFRYVKGNGEHEQQVHNVRSSDDSGRVSDNQALKKLTEEFHKLRTSLEGTLPTFRTLQNENQIPHQQEYCQRHKQIVDAHERQLAEIQASNQHLEQQKDEIRTRLSELKLGNSSSSQIEELLMELNTQEKKNKLTLNALSEQVKLLQVATGNRRNLDSATNRKTHSIVNKMDENAIFKSMVFPAAIGPLSSEIQMLYLTYLQSGGSDHHIIRQMYELQLEATALEKNGTKPEQNGRKKKYEDGLNSKTLDAELLSVELENQRLEDEILKMKILKDRRRMENGSLDLELDKLQQVHMAEMAQLHAEIGRLRHNIERRKVQWSRRGSPPLLPPPIAPPLPPPPPPHLGLPDPTILTRNMDPMGSSATGINQYFLDPSDTLGPAPYDPVSGFVIFYDFLLGLDPMFYHVRLVSGLYRNGQQLGKSTPLPIVSSDMGHSPQSLMDRQRACCAILAARQPVPRILPSTSISLVAELQASGGFDVYGQEIQNLSPRGWAKTNIFDHLHQVMSGHWKVPIRVLPVKPGLTEEQLNGVPQVGKAELYLRLVNARDADMQSMADIQPGRASLYKYLPAASSSTAPPIDFPPTQHSFHPAPTSLSFSASPYTGLVDPPPNQEQSVQLKSNERGEKIPLNPIPKQRNYRQPKETRLGIILDKVKGAPPGNGAIRLTGYHQKTGRMICTSNSGFNYCTNFIRSDIKHSYFIFGEEQVIFWDVMPQEDMILVARFYHCPKGREASAFWDNKFTSHYPSLGSEQWLAAWAVFRLTKRFESCEVMFAGAKKEEESRMTTWNIGTHTLSLYQCPVPLITVLPTVPAEHKMYGDATLRLHIFSTQKPELPFPPELPATLDPTEA
ncbi:coiled-coil domain-containing protein 17 [Pituophis catenifer annectens]|uniref:coiled-coil domain-containing protein 17 n=1 Tax=Pituophis catenifer annectens TaxID=94852 RepID=UPI0039914673